MKRLILRLFLFGIYSANITPEVAAQHYFRSAASGNWSSTATWQMSVDGINWIAATSTPSYTDYTIEISDGDSITINTGITIDQVIIDEGAVLNCNVSISNLSINNGAGADLIVNGTFYDNIGGGFSIFFASGATWQMGNSATFIKTTSSSSNNWQQNYQGGIQTIPPTANWIIRKNSTQNPSVTTVGAFYPNLIIENYTSSVYVTPTVAVSFNGSSNYPTILGNLDIGGSGTNYVNFYNGHTNAQPTKVMGNFTVRSGNTFRNYGTGIEVQGNVSIDGTVVYDSNDRRLFDFTGTTEQTISGNGILNIYNLRINKSSGNVTLNRSVTVDDSLYLWNGLFLSSNSNLIAIASAAIVSGASSVSYVNGPMRKLGAAQFVFPIGSSGIYKPLSISGGGLSSNSYIAEYFHDDPKTNLSNQFALPIDHISTCEYWKITKESGTQARSISLYWDDNSCGVTNIADLIVVYNDGSSAWTNTGVTAVNGTTINGTISSTAINVFGYFTLGSVSTANPLPVSLLRFVARQQADGVHLTWTTASEINNDYFEILSSADAHSFETIGRVTGLGNSNSLIEYSFTDDREQNAVVYYKLRQVDYDGKENFSEVISVNAIRNFTANVFPNPFTTQAMIEINNTNENDFGVELFDIVGKPVNCEINRTGNRTISFTSEASAPGIYFIRITSSEDSIVLKVQKE